jgi:hypothetical protein
MSAEAPAPQLTPNELNPQQMPDAQKPLLVVDLPNQDDFGVRRSELPGNPVEAPMNTAPAVESLYNNEKKDRLSARAAIRLGVLAESLSQKAEDAAYGLNTRRSPSEVVDDLRSQGQEAYDNALERGRATAKRIGEQVSGTWADAKAYTDVRVQTAKELGEKGIESIKTFFRDQKEAAVQRKNARIEKREAHKEERRIDKEQRKDFLERREQARQEKRQERRARMTDFIDTKIEAGTEKKDQYVKVGKAALKTTGLVAIGAADAAARKGAEKVRQAKEFTQEKKELVQRDIARAKEAATDTYDQAKQVAYVGRGNWYQHRAAQYEQRATDYRTRAVNSAKRAVQ